ncbi:response regulator transcription factor [Chloroflexota bacterium]
MKKKILIADSDPAFVELASQLLTNQGYEVLTVSGGENALRLLFSYQPDMVLLNTQMPGMDSRQVLSRIREIYSVPIILLSYGQKSEDDIAYWLDRGADYYLTNPVGNKELVARVRAVLRRSKLPSWIDTKEEITYSDDCISVNVAQWKVVVNGKRVRLTPTEFRLLTRLLENAGRVLTHRQIMEGMRGREYISNLDHRRVHICNLRHKIESDPTHPRYIITEPNIGYYFQKAIPENVTLAIRCRGTLETSA